MRGLQTTIGCAQESFDEPGIWLAFPIDLLIIAPWTVYSEIGFRFHTTTVNKAEFDVVDIPDQPRIYNATYSLLLG